MIEIILPSLSSQSYPAYTLNVLKKEFVNNKTVGLKRTDCWNFQEKNKDIF